MSGLTGGAYGPDPRGYLDEEDLREMARAGAEILEQHAVPDPDRPRRRWEERRIEGVLTWVEVERIEEDADDTPLR